MNTIQSYPKWMTPPAIQELEMFDPRNFINFLGKKAQEVKETPLIKSLLLQSLAGASAVQPGQNAKWSQCEDDLGVFTMDPDYTTSVPNPVQKDQNVVLQLLGPISDTLAIERITVHTDWE